MDEKQRKQIEIIHSALTDECRDLLQQSVDSLREAGKVLLKDLTAYDVVSGHSEVMLAGSAIMQIRQQLELILQGNE